jgi:hypothetical protein
MNMRFKISFARVQFLSFLDIHIKSYGEMKFLKEVWARRGSVRGPLIEVKSYICSQKIYIYIFSVVWLCLIVTRISKKKSFIQGRRRRKFH